MKNKKGIVIEMAIFFILIGSVVGTLLISNSMLMNSQNNLLVAVNNHALELEQLGDAFAADPNTTPSSENYDIDISGREMTVMTKGGTDVVLTVTLDESGNIIGWTNGPKS